MKRVILLLALAACSKESTPSPTPTATAARTAAPIATAVSTAPPSATAGKSATFTGETTTAAATLTVPPGERPFKGENAAPDGVGPVKLKLVTHETGVVDGTASGALGDMVVTGRVWDSHVSATLTPVSPAATAFAGIVYGTRKGSTVDAKLQASRTDGTMLRTADLKLSAP
jgi:hypothetical protein